MRAVCRMLGASGFIGMAAALAEGPILPLCSVCTDSAHTHLYIMPQLLQIESGPLPIESPRGTALLAKCKALGRSSAGAMAALYSRSGYACVDCRKIV